MKGCFPMLSVLVFALVILLLVADAVIFYVAGIPYFSLTSQKHAKNPFENPFLSNDFPVFPVHYGYGTATPSR